MLMLRAFIIISLAFSLVEESSASKGGALGVVESCWDQLFSDSLTLGQKQDLATVAFTTIATGTVPLYEKKDPVVLPKRLGGKTFEVQTPDETLSQVRFVGLSRTKVANNDQVTLYMEITAAAATLGVDIISIVENAQSLSRIRPWQRHLDLLHNLSQFVQDTLRKDSSETQLDKFFSGLTFNTSYTDRPEEDEVMDAPNFLGCVMEEVLRAVNKRVLAGKPYPITDDPHRISGIAAALTQTNTQLEMEQPTRNGVLPAVAWLSASTPTLAAAEWKDLGGEPQASRAASQPIITEGKRAHKEDETDRLLAALGDGPARTAADMMLDHIVVSPKGDFNEVDTYGSLLIRVAGMEEVLSAARANEGKLIAIARQEHLYRLAETATHGKFHVSSPSETVIDDTGASAAAPAPAPRKFRTFTATRKTDSSAAEKGGGEAEKKKAAGDDVELQRQQLELEKQRLALEKEKFEFEKQKAAAAASTTTPAGTEPGVHPIAGKTVKNLAGIGQLVGTSSGGVSFKLNKIFKL